MGASIQILDLGGHEAKALALLHVISGVVSMEDIAAEHNCSIPS